MADETRTRIEQPDTPAVGTDYAQLTRAVQDLIDVMRRGEIEHLEVSQGDLHILLSARSSNSDSVQVISPVSEEHRSSEATASEPAKEDGVQYHHITSPMVGTFYEAPSPGDPPFVRPGDTVEAGQTVAIIEAMKIMNEIVADRSGIVDAVLAENGEAVEYGHPLFRLRPV